MCHMIADSTEELLEMADKIGVKRKWIQWAGTPKEHFDICLSKRAMAVLQGAEEISQRELGMKIGYRIKLKEASNSVYFDHDLKISSVKPSVVVGSLGLPVSRTRSPAGRFNVGIETKGS